MSNVTLVKNVQVNAWLNTNVKFKTNKRDKTVTCSVRGFDNQIVISELNGKFTARAMHNLKSVEVELTTRSPEKAFAKMAKLVWMM